MPTTIAPLTQALKTSPWTTSAASAYTTANLARPAYRSLSNTRRHTTATRSIVPQHFPHNGINKTISRIPKESTQWSPNKTFSTSPQRQKAILNPRQDEDGNEMNIEITPRAANRLKQIMTTESNPTLALRVSVESGGCHGFQYLMSLTDMSAISPEEDTVFEGRDNTKVVMDEPSLELLKGSKVDYTMELIGSQFKVVDNPLASSSCGCGTSFDIKI